MKPLAVVRGAGDLGTAVGRRLHLCGFSVIHLEAEKPSVIRRAVAFASAVFERRSAVEGVTALLARDTAEAREILDRDLVAVLVDPGALSMAALRPDLVVDAILAKRNTGTVLSMATRVVGLGPGFTAGVDVHAVVETSRGHDLGRVYWSGTALPDTGVPGLVGGVGAARVLRAPRAGLFRPRKAIGERVLAGEVAGEVEGEPVRASISGVLRGILYPDLTVESRQKVGDVDPRGRRELCFTISDKANAVAGGVLEAAMCVGAPRSLAEASAGGSE